MRKYWIYLFICCFVILCGYFLYFEQFEFFQTIDDRIQDVKFRFRKTVKPSNKVVLVEIDGKSIDKIGRWPWKRNVIAQLIKKIDKLGAKTIALDMVFSEYSNKKDDEILTKAISDSKKVVLGFFFRSQEKKNEKDIANKNLPDYCIENIQVIGEVDTIPIKNFPTAETNIYPISSAGVGKGFFSVFPDSDGILRRLHLIAAFDGYLMPSLSLAAISNYLSQPIFVIIDKYGVVELKVDNKKIPVSNTGSLLINFYGKGHTIPHVSAIDILQGHVSKDILKDKLIFLGVTEKAVGDLVPTPTDPNFPGTEVHCTMASNILQNFYLVRNTYVYLIDFLSLLIIPVILTTISMKTKNTLLSLLNFFVFGVLYVFFNIYLFSAYNIRIATIYPFVQFILSFVLLESYRNFVIEQRSRYLKKAFSSYIAKELVNEVLRSPEKLKLGGEKRVVTVLFLDIRDFTYISENLNPEDLVNLLNSFFGPVTDIILKNKGMLDKYIGDAIMALFNVPVDLPDHAKAAVKSAKEIIECVKDFNDIYNKKGYPQIRVGIGINTGEAVVGNLGTKTRFDYTAIGDTVNLASRVEGLNKYFNTNVLMTEYTAKKLSQEDFLIRYIGKVIVKGKTSPVKLYELITDLDLTNDDINDFERALDLLSKGDLHMAKNIFERLYKKFNDYLSEYYLKLITNITHPHDLNSDLSIIRFDKK